MFLFLQKQAALNVAPGIESDGLLQPQVAFRIVGKEVY